MNGTSPAKRWVPLGPATLLVILLAFTSCNSPEESFQTRWAVAGTVDFSGYSVPSGKPEVKLAAFFIGTGSEPGEGAIVSNVVNLGTDGGIFSFTLTVDASGLSPADGEYIRFFMWSDLNENDAYEIGESFQTPKGKAACPIFGGGFGCDMEFSRQGSGFLGAGRGWNTIKGFLDYTPITGQEITGARIEDALGWM